MTDPFRLPDELDAIAAQMPLAPNPVRQMLGLLPNPLSPRLAGSSQTMLPVAPDDAASQLTGDAPGSVSGATLTPGSTPGAVLQPLAIDASRLGLGSVDLSKFAAGIVPPRVVAALPALPNAAWPQGSLAFLTTDNHLYKTNGSTWTDQGDATQIVGQLQAAQIAADAIQAQHLAVGGLSNLVTNPSFEVDARLMQATQAAPNAVTGWTLATWGGNTGATATVRNMTDLASVPNGQQFIGLYGGTTGQSSLMSAYMVPCAPGDLIAISCQVYDPSGAVGLAFYDLAGSWISNLTVATRSAAAAAWLRVGGLATAPAGARFVRALLDPTGPGVATTRRFDDVQMMTGGTLIDSTGIYIFNGRLVFVDVQEQTILDSSGFGPTWVDFIHLGLRNGLMSSVTVGPLSVGTSSTDPAGRNTRLAGWTLWRHGGAATVTATGTGGSFFAGSTAYAKFSAGGVGNDINYTSDTFPVTPGTKGQASLYWADVIPVGIGMYVSVALSFFKADGSLITTMTYNWGERLNAAQQTLPARWVSPQVVSVPLTARNAQVTIQVYESTGHSAATEFDFGGAAFLSAPEGNSIIDLSVSTLSLAGNPVFPDDILLANLTASMNNWDPTGIGVGGFARIIVTPNGAWTLTGMIAGAEGQRIWLHNAGASSITLAYESASSSANNRFRAGGAANVTLRNQGSVQLLYYSSRWRVLGA